MIFLQLKIILINSKIPNQLNRINNIKIKIVIQIIIITAITLINQNKIIIQTITMQINNIKIKIVIQIIIITTITLINQNKINKYPLQVIQINYIKPIQKNFQTTIWIILLKVSLIGNQWKQVQ